MTDIRRSAPNWRLLPWLVAVVCALGGAWFGAGYELARNENELLRQREQLADLALRSEKVRSEADHILVTRLATDLGAFKAAEGEQRRDDLARLQLSVLSAPHGGSGALGAAVWDPARQSGVFSARGLTPTAKGERYEFWLMGTQPVSAATFTVPADGQARVELKSPTSIAGALRFVVSRERDDRGDAHATPADIVLASD